MHNINNLAISLATKIRRGLLKHNFRKVPIRCRSTVEKPPEVKMSPDYSIPKGIFGQATCHTHPHLIQPGHLTCGITQAEYRDRRDTLVHKLISEKENMYKNHIIIIPAARKQYMSDKIPYVFRQNSDFFYLTGCLEPSAVLVMVKPAQTETFKSTLFVHDNDAHAELWEGPRTGCTAASKLFAVDQAMPVESFGSFINRIVLSSRPAMVWYYDDGIADASVSSAVALATQSAHVTQGNPQRELHFMRVIKSPAEIELMEEVCYIGAQTMNMAMACTKPGISEQSVSAVLEYSGKQAGAEHAAFPPVVAGGNRATHIHYISNNQLLAAQDMLLVDSGCQRWMYNSDISRTWPVSGKFSPHHKILYELVLAVQKRLIEVLGDHRPALDQLFDSMCRLLGTYLQQEGILPKNIDGNELIGRAYRLCPHHVSHYLGLDVHDAPLVRRAAPVAPGMVVTIEPGIYIRSDDTTVPAEFRGVGVRVEDDVLITESAPKVLTDAAVKETSHIEELVGKHAL